MMEGFGKFSAHAQESGSVAFFPQGVAVRPRRTSDCSEIAEQFPSIKKAKRLLSVTVWLFLCAKDIYNHLLS